MSDEAEAIPEYLHEAARIFRSELESHVSYLRAVQADFSAAAADSLRELLAKHAPVLAEKFHLIKGASGFLKLTRLKDLASEQEKYFRSPQILELRAPPDLSRAVEMLDHQIAALGRLPKKNS